MTTHLYDGYVRVSRVNGRDGDTFISPAVQREQVEAWARGRGARIAEWHTDLDVSGAARGRRGLEEGIARVQRGDVAGVVVARLDRLARSLPVAFDVIDRIEAAGGVLVSVEEGVDPSTPAGELMRGLLLLMAAWYRRQVTESWDTARERAIARGAHIGYAPTGYRRRPDGTLEPDGWAPTVRELFERRARGEAWVELARWFNAEGVPAPRSQRWTGATVSQLVRVRTYLGEVRSGDYVNRGAHVALVTPAVFAAAQEARGLAPARTSRPGLLNGLIRCAGCGYAMYRGSGKAAGGTRAFAYRCGGNHAGGVCPERGFARADELDAMVERWLFHHAAGLAVAPVAGDDGELEAAVAAVGEAEHALAVFRDDPRIIGALGVDRFAEGLAARARAVDAARVAAAAARRDVVGLPDAVTLRGLWPSLGVEQRRRLLGAVIDFVVVAGRGPLTADRVRVCEAGTAPDGLPRRGRVGGGVVPIVLERLPAVSRVDVGG